MTDRKSWREFSKETPRNIKEINIIASWSWNQMSSLELFLYKDTNPDERRRATELGSKTLPRSPQRDQWPLKTLKHHFRPQQMRNTYHNWTRGSRAESSAKKHWKICRSTLFTAGLESKRVSLRLDGVRKQEVKSLLKAHILCFFFAFFSRRRDILLHQAAGYGSISSSVFTPLRDFTPLTPGYFLC